MPYDAVSLPGPQQTYRVPMGERSLCGTHPRHPAAGSDFCKGLLPLPPDAPRQRTQLRDERRSWQLSLTCRERKRGDCRIELVKRNNGKKYTRGGTRCARCGRPYATKTAPTVAAGCARGEPAKDAGTSTVFTTRLLPMSPRRNDARQELNPDSRGR